MPQAALSTQTNTCRESTQKLLVAQRKNEVGHLTDSKLWESSCRPVPAVMKLHHTAGQQWHCCKQETTQSSGWDCLLKELGGESALEGSVYFEEIQGINTASKGLWHVPDPRTPYPQAH